MEGFFRDIIESFRDNYLSIVALKSILNSKELQLDLIELFGPKIASEQQTPEEQASKIRLIKDSIVSSFERETIIQYEALIIEDLEAIAEETDEENYVESWRLACSEYASMQVDKHKALYAAMQTLISESTFDLEQNSQYYQEDQRDSSVVEAQFTNSRIKSKTSQRGDMKAIYNEGSVDDEQFLDDSIPRATQPPIPEESEWENSPTKNNLRAGAPSSRSHSPRVTTRRVAFNRMNNLVKNKVDEHHAKSPKSMKISKEQKLAYLKQDVVASRDLDSIHFRNCNHLDDAKILAARKTPQPQSYIQRLSEVNKRRTNMERLLKDKVNQVHRSINERIILEDELEKVAHVQRELDIKYLEKQKLVEELDKKRTELAQIKHSLKEMYVDDAQLQHLERLRAAIDTKITQLKEKLNQFDREDGRERRFDLDSVQEKYLELDWKDLDGYPTHFDLVEDKLALLKARKDKKRASELFAAWKGEYLENRKERRARILLENKRMEKEKLENLKILKEKEVYDKQTEKLRLIAAGNFEDSEPKKSYQKVLQKQRRFKRKARYFGSKLEDILKRKMWDAFILISKPDLESYQNHMQTFKKSQILEALKNQVIQTKINNQKAEQFREVWLKRKARRMVDGFKLEYFNYKDLQQRLKYYQANFSSKFLHIWKMKFQDEKRRRQKVEFIQRRSARLAKRYLMRLLHQNLEKKQIQNGALKIALKARNKMRFKLRFRQFRIGTALDKLIEKFGGHRYQNKVRLSFGEMKKFTKERTKIKKFVKKIENSLKNGESHLKNEVVSEFAENMRLQRNIEDRFHSYNKRTRRSKILKIWKSLQRNTFFQKSKKSKEMRQAQSEKQIEKDEGLENRQVLHQEVQDLRVKQGSQKDVLNDKDKKSDQLKLSIKKLKDSLIVLQHLSIQKQQELDKTALSTSETIYSLQTKSSELLDQIAHSREDITNFRLKRDVLKEQKNKKLLRLTETKSILENLKKQKEEQDQVDNKELRILEKELCDQKVGEGVSKDNLSKIQNEIENYDYRMQQVKNGIEIIEVNSLSKNFIREADYRHSHDLMTEKYESAILQNENSKKANKQAEVEIFKDRLYDSYSSNGNGGYLVEDTTPQAELRSRRVGGAPKQVRFLDQSSIQGAYLPEEEGVKIYELYRDLEMTGASTVQGLDGSREHEVQDLELLQKELASLKVHRTQMKEGLLDRMISLEKEMDGYAVN